MIDHHIRGDRSFFIIYSLRHEMIEDAADLFNLSEIKEAGDGIESRSRLGDVRRCLISVRLNPV